MKMATNISCNMPGQNISIKYINTVVVSAITYCLEHSSVLAALSASNLML